MKLNKEKFLQTELGAELEETIRCWDDALEKRKEARTGFNSGDAGCGLGVKYWNNTCQSCQDKWEVFKLAIKQFYGIEYNFTRTDEYFGLVTEDGADWLIREERERNEKE